MIPQPTQQPKPVNQRNLRRRIFLFLTSLALAYPLFSFLGYKAPKKPKTIKVQIQIKPGDYHIEPDFILFENSDQPWAVSRKCTHLGCTIQFREQGRVFECPCHQSRFSDHGIVINGPAKRNLPMYHVERIKDKDTYLVTIQ